MKETAAVVDRPRSALEARAIGAGITCPEMLKVIECSRGLTFGQVETVFRFLTRNVAIWPHPDAARSERTTA